MNCEAMLAPAWEKACKAIKRVLKTGIKAPTPAAASRNGRIAVLTTESTARSERLARLIRQHAGSVHVDVLACPGWATRVEALKLDDPGFAAAAGGLLEPVLAAGVDEVVLGCTHYAFLVPVLEPIVVGRAMLVDVADAVARLWHAKAAAPSAQPAAPAASARPGRVQQVQRAAPQQSKTIA